MKVWTSYRLRMQRRHLQIRALRKRRELMSVQNRTAQIKAHDVLLFCTFRNEDMRLPHFFDYYRKLGIDHFIMVDNDSDDGSREFVAKQPDTSVWSTNGHYANSRYGMDWLTWLQIKYAHNHWSLTVDVDELFIYPFCDTRPIQALGDWLDASGVRSFGAMMLDLYPKSSKIGPYQKGSDPLDILAWFDSGNYMMSKNQKYKNLWIQGGPRARAFFADTPKKAPALNKIPFVKWDKKYTYASSTHMILPRGLNLVYDESGGEKPSGILLHTKFLDTFVDRVKEESARQQHYKKGREYKTYADNADAPDLWCSWSERYIGWRQLEMLGLMSKGSWA